MGGPRRPHSGRPTLRPAAAFSWAEPAEQKLAVKCQLGKVSWAWAVGPPPRGCRARPASLWVLLATPPLLMGVIISIHPQLIASTKGSLPQRS